MLCPWRLEMMRDHIFGISDRFLGISPADVFVCTDIVFFLVKNLRCIRRCCFLNRMYMRKRLILYLDKFDRFFCGFTVFCRYECDRIAEIMYERADRDQSVLIMLQMTDLVLAWDILCSYNCFHTRKCFCFGSIDGKHSRTCIFTSESDSIKHAIQVKIIRIFTVSEDFFLYIDPCHAIAKCPVRGTIIWNFACF